MKLLLILFPLFIMPNAASAQCIGVFSDGQVCGKSAGPEELPGSVTLRTAFDRVFEANENLVISRGPNRWQAVAPSGEYKVINPMDPPYNAKCDGLTDDGVALQAALNDLGKGDKNAFFLPPTGGCKSSSLLTYDSRMGKGALIYGAGPLSKLIAESLSGGLKITGGCGVGREKIFLKNFEIDSGASEDSAFALYLNGIAGYGVSDVNVISVRNKFTIGIVGSGAQQGYIHGGLSIGNGIGFLLNDCNYGGVGTVSSNGVDVGGGRTWSDVTAAIDIEGGASDVWVHNNHIGTSAYAVINNQSNGTGGRGANYITQNHFEGDATISLDLRAGIVEYNDNNDYNRNSVNVHPGARLNAHGNNPIQGAITFANGTHGTIYNNRLNGSYTDNNIDPCAVVQWNNINAGQPKSATCFNSAASFTSVATSAGDILTLNANRGVRGPWGITVKGAGVSEDVYLTLGNVTIAGNTAGGHLYVKSGPDGTHWSDFTATGLSVGQLTSTVPTGAPPLIVASTTNIQNLNASSLNGATFAAPGAIGGGTPNTGAFTSLAASENILNTSSAPTLSSCGTGPSTASGSSNQGGQFTTGSGAPSACTVTFSSTYPTYAYCTISPANVVASAAAVLAFVSSSSKSSFTATFAVGTSNAAFNYSCNGN